MSNNKWQIFIQSLTIFISCIIVNISLKTNLVWLILLFPIMTFLFRFTSISYDIIYEIVEKEIEGNKKYKELKTYDTLTYYIEFNKLADEIYSEYTSYERFILTLQKMKRNITNKKTRHILALLYIFIPLFIILIYFICSFFVKYV